ncbi:MAG: hypothetical protein DRH12_14900 [Deltaproteobacteria bacterium]|nr:MAG: hypothetical protein DRH12_14900 [Deltaproteobacteria bacterium]
MIHGKLGRTRFVNHPRRFHPGRGVVKVAPAFFVRLDQIIHMKSSIFEKTSSKMLRVNEQ